VVVVYQYRTGFPTWQDRNPQGVTLIHRVA